LAGRLVAWFAGCLVRWLPASWLVDIAFGLIVCWSVGCKDLLVVWFVSWLVACFACCAWFGMLVGWLYCCQVPALQAAPVHGQDQRQAYLLQPAVRVVFSSALLVSHS
jgi:hypothetical protein